MSDNGLYQGWTNRETWAVKLHWDNDEGDQCFFKEQAKIFYVSNKSVREFADFLKEQYETLLDRFSECIENNVAPNKEAWLMIQDVGSYWLVNWYEIAQAYYQEVEVSECPAECKTEKVEVGQ